MKGYKCLKKVTHQRDKKKKNGTTDFQNSPPFESMFLCENHWKF